MILREDKLDFMTLLADADPDHEEVIMTQLAQLGYKVNITVDAMGRVYADDFQTMAEGPNIRTALKRYIEKL